MLTLTFDLDGVAPRVEVVDCGQIRAVVIWIAGPEWPRCSRQLGTSMVSPTTGSAARHLQGTRLNSFLSRRGTTKD